MDKDFFNFKIIKYEDDNLSLDVKVDYQNKTVWLTQKDMTILFDKSQPTIAEHIKNIFEEAQAKRKVREPEHVKKVKKSNGYQVPYFVMLENIASDLASEQPKSEADIKGYERNVEKCTIPEDWAFSDYPAMVEDALKYIAYYLEIVKPEYKKFVGEVITCLSEAICNGMRSNTKSVEPMLIIRRINEIIHDDDYSFQQWLHDFGEKYSEMLEYNAGNIGNKHAYLKTCCINYLTEHRAGIIPGFMDYEE